MKRLNRRALLRGVSAAGAVAVGLPLLEAMLPRSASAADAAAPKRIVFWFTANGTLPAIWTPDINDLSQHPIHAPLHPLRDKLIFLDGVNNQMAKQSIGDGHQTGMACLLTNAPILPGNLFCEGSCPAGNEQYVGWGGGISVDQYLANEIEKDATTKFRSLELGVQVRNASVWSRLIYAGPDQPVPPREDPNANFVDFFGDLDADPFALAMLVRKRKSVLDVVMDDYKKLNSKLGYDDRLKLESHLEAVRTVEKRLDVTNSFGAACGAPTFEEIQGNVINNNSLYPAVGKAQMDMLVMALACDMTRVASLQWSRSVSNVVFDWLPDPIPEGHHGLSHADDGDGYAVDAITRINHWYTEQFAYLLTQMDAIQEGDRSMLDNSVVVWVNELGKGNSHTRNDIPFIVAGGCQGYFNTGQVLDAGGDHHGKLLVSLCHAMDKPVDTFGEQQFSQGPLNGLT